MEEPYRIAVLAIFLAALLITAYRRILAARTGERFDRREEGLLVAIVLRLAGMCLGVTAVLYLMHPETLVSSSLPLPAAVRWLGAPLGAAAIVLLFFTLRALGKNLTDTVATRRAATLVTNGPYRWVRHPFYVAAGLLMLAVSLLSANVLIAASGMLVMTLLVVRTPREEARLIAAFGDAYREYMQRTPRFIPRLR